MYELRMHSTLMRWMVLCKVILLMTLFFPWDVNVQIAKPCNLRGEMPNPYELEQDQGTWTSVPLKIPATTCSPCGAFVSVWNQREILHFVA